MRIGSDLLITQAQDSSIRQRTAAKAASPLRDMLAIGPRRAEARAADMDVKQTQNTMTLFRIAEDALAKAEDAVIRMTGLAAGAESGDLSASEINTAALEAPMLAASADAALRGAKMGGVALFSANGESDALWSVAAGNASALGAADENAGIAEFGRTSLETLGIKGIRITDAGARQTLSEAAAKLSFARATMHSSAESLGRTALELTMDAISSLSAAARSNDRGASAGLLSFVMENADFASDAIASTLSIEA